MEELAELRPVLKPSQEHVLTTLAGRDEPFFARVDYEAIAHVSRSQAAYDLADLVKLGLVERLGSGRSTRYRLVPARGGRRRKWTRERIRAELRELCEEVGRWPTATEFRAAGHGDLYLAASRYGGIEHWADELGFGEARRPPRRARLPLAGVARPARAVALAALAALGLGLIAGSHMPLDPPPGSAVAPAASLAGSVPPRPEVPPTDHATPNPATVDRRLAARGGDSWLSVRRGSAAGPVVWEGMLRGGKSIRLRGERLWVRLQAPWNLTARLNGDRIVLPPRTSTVVARRTGLRLLRMAPPPEPAVLVDATPSAPAVAASSAPASPASAPSGGAPSPDQPPGSGGPTPDPRP